MYFVLKRLHSTAISSFSHQLCCSCIAINFAYLFIQNKKFVNKIFEFWSITFGMNWMNETLILFCSLFVIASIFAKIIRLYALAQNWYTLSLHALVISSSLPSPKNTTKYYSCFWLLGKSFHNLVKSSKHCLPKLFEASGSIAHWRSKFS